MKSANTGGFAGAPNGGHATLNFMSEAHVFNMVGHAAVGCGTAVASGGKCGPGALAGAVGSFTSNLPLDLDFNTGLIVTTVSGGVASLVGGGKFGNGAITAAFGYLYNAKANRDCADAPTDCGAPLLEAGGGGGRGGYGGGPTTSGNISQTAIGRAFQAIEEAIFGTQGVVYDLRDAGGSVMRSGRTGDFSSARISTF